MPDAKKALADVLMAYKALATYGPLADRQHIEQEKERAAQDAALQAKAKASPEGEHTTAHK